MKDFSRIIPEIRKEVCPGECAENIVREKLSIRHLADAGDDRYEGPDDRYEAGERDGDRPVFFIECLSSYQVFLAEEAGVRTVEQFASNFFAKEVACLLAEKRAEKEEKGEEMDVDLPKRTNTLLNEEARSKQETVTGKKKSDEEP